MEVKFYTRTVENLNGKVWPAKFLNGKGVVAWMRGYSAGKRHFGLNNVALYALADVKISDTI